MGLVITKITAGGQADKLGLRVGDVIDSYADTLIVSNDALSEAMRAASSPSKLVYLRDDTANEVIVAPRPDGHPHGVGGGSVRT